MDQDIRDSLNDIKSTVQAGFDKVDARIDKLVTQGEFNATVQRIDAQHDILRRDFDSHEKRSGEIIAEGRASDADVLRKAEVSNESLRKDLRTELEGFRTTTRWSISLAAGLSGVIFSIATWLLSL